ncbi:MAG TPA: ABC transporter substrate-binding protein [Candidatus Binatia bacterium]|nr:ABC transporter substrate-binding protein [Candidatus Binatia bacterium]
MRRASRLVFAIAFAFSLTGSAARGEGGTKVVVSWGTVAISNTPLWVTYRAGLFKKHGLDVDLQYVASTLQIPSLLSGSVQIGQVGGTNVVSADVGGADLIILATLSPVFPYLFMVSSGIKTPAQLKGKAIGVSKFGDASDVGARIAMRHVGLDPKDVTFVQVGSSTNRATALINGAIAGGVIIPPMNVELEAHGLHTLIDLARLRVPAADITITARRSWVNAHRDVVQAYIDAIVEGIDRVRTDKAFAVATIKEYFKSDDDKAMAAGYDFFIREILTSLPYPRTAQFANSLDELATSNDKVKGFDVSKILDDSFLRSAAARRTR